MIVSNPTVRDGSTKNFRRNGNLRAQIFPEHDSEPQATRLSSVKDVTATRAVQTHCHSEQVFFASEQSRVWFASSSRCVHLTARPLPSPLSVIYTYRLP